jgi:hypothetical protein
MCVGSFYVLSPDKEWYIHDLIADFEKSPQQKTVEAALAAADSVRYGAFRKFTEAARRAVTKWINEWWDIELLREDVETTAENESSAILYAWMAEYKHGILLTGDAGIRALTKAMDYLESHSVSASASIKFMQIPHHGGRHNVSTSVLDRLVGPRLLTQPQNPEKSAFVSASAESDYPRKMVANAFLRRGAEVVATKGWTIRHSRGMPDRGWSTAESLAFSSKVEAWED